MKNYENYEHILVKDMLKQKDRDYYVFLYFTYCPHCNKIKSEFFDFIDSHKDKKFYLVQMDGEKDAHYFKDVENTEGVPRDEFIKSYVDASIGKGELKDIGYYYVPCLYHIVDGKVADMHVAEFDIHDYLQEISK